MDCISFPAGNHFRGTGGNWTNFWPGMAIFFLNGALNCSWWPSRCAPSWGRAAGAGPSWRPREARGGPGNQAARPSNKT